MAGKNDIEIANKLQDKASWTPNRDGKKLRAHEDDVRCKKGGDLVPLDLNLRYLEGRSIANIVQAMPSIIWHSATLVPSSADDLLSSLYRQMRQRI